MSGARLTRARAASTVIESRTRSSTESHTHLAVLGSPIAHSKSPTIHAAAYEALGLDWRYGREELRETELEAFLTGRGPEWRGFSLTMPLKEEAHRLAIALDPVAERSGVVNTLLRVVGPGSAPAWAGFNTDVAGLAAAVREAGLDPTNTVVLGAGATAVSAALAAQQLGADRVAVVARRIEPAHRLASRFDAEAAPLGSPEAELLCADATLVISTLPGPAGSQVELSDGVMRVPLFDVAYDPWPSPLAERWREHGGEAYPGLAMLVQQALAQLRIFVGGDPGFQLDREAEVLQAMRSALEQRPEPADED